MDERYVDRSAPKKPDSGSQSEELLIRGPFLCMTEYGPFETFPVVDVAMR
jgi:hypothetical protein